VICSCGGPLAADVGCERLAAFRGLDVAVRPLEGLSWAGVLDGVVSAMRMLEVVLTAGAILASGLLFLCIIGRLLWL